MKTFPALLALCERNPPVTGGFPLQRPVTRSFDAVFDLRLNKRLSKQWRRRWFETSSRSLLLRYNALDYVALLPCTKSVFEFMLFYHLFDQFPRQYRDISMAQYKTVVYPLLTHWGYCGLAQNRRCIPSQYYANNNVSCFTLPLWWSLW